MVRNKFIPYLAIIINIALLTIALDKKVIPGTGTWNLPELRTIDFRFLFRSTPAHDAAQDIAVIVIDEETYKAFDQPMIFYHREISRVLDYLSESGARVIGLDIELPSISLEERVQGGYESVYARSLVTARKIHGVDIVIGYSSAGNPPFQTYLAAAGRDNLASLNLSEDADETIRRQQLYVESNGTRYDSLAYLLARKFTGTSLSDYARTILIDYTLSQNIPVYSFDKVHRLSTQRNPQPDLFRGKAVLIGTSLSYDDKHATPLGHFRFGGKNRMTDGVMIQATVLNTLLARSIFREPGAFQNALVIFALTFLSVILCRNRRPLNALLICLAETVILIVLSVIAFNNNYLVRMTPLLAVIAFSFGATTILHYYMEERKRKKIRERFASYLPENVIDRIVDADIEKLTQGESKDLALLFCDIRDFTSFSEINKGDPQKVVNFLNQYHKEMTEIIMKNEGTVAQLTGDGIFAFFGAPAELGNPVLSAVKAAIQMQEAIVQSRDKWRKLGMENLRIGIGVHFGESIVGNIGSVRKMDYVAIGDNTNVASRIEGLTKEYHEAILVSRAAYECVQEDVVARPLGYVKIKGHSEVFVLAVDGLNKTIS